MDASAAGLGDSRSAARTRAVVWDWNGTLLDDTAVALASMNAALAASGLQQVADLDAYRGHFTFPITDFYRSVGFDVGDAAVYRRAANTYLDHFGAHVQAAPLQEGALDTVAAIRARGVTQVLISATQEQLLAQQLAPHRRLVELLDGVRGGSDAHAPAKHEVVADWLDGSGLSSDEVLMVGDTGHDREIAEALGVRFAWFTGGHQRLDLQGSDPDRVATIKRLDQVLDLI